MAVGKAWIRMGNETTIFPWMAERTPGLWMACSEPERQPDALICWHYSGCAACRVKAEVAARMYPDDTHVAWLLTQMHTAS